MPGTYHWLHVDAEVPAPRTSTRRANRAERRAFARACVAACEALGLPRWQACEAAAIAVLECGWGAFARGNNLWGQKAKRDIAARYLARTGRHLPWYRARGHVESNDKPEVYYVAFASVADGWAFWVDRYVGLPGTPPAAKAYAECARRFWAGDPDWIDALIGACYRGTRTRDDAERRAESVEGHRGLAATVAALAA